MVERIGSGGALAREALRAALRASELAAKPAPGAEAAAGALADRHAGGAGATDAAGGADFARALGQGLEAVDTKVQATEQLPTDLLTGRIDDFHEIAVQLKSAELSFRFAMEIRNKLVDAYREIMRMSV
jgi:flagellar hook-basal body complex protein FliE